MRLMVGESSTTKMLFVLISSDTSVRRHTSFGDLAGAEGTPEANRLKGYWGTAIVREREKLTNRVLDSDLVFQGIRFTSFRGGKTLLYMVVEHFRNQDPLPVYRRFREHGRLAPEGLEYVSSWVDGKFERCFQLMKTEDRGLLDEWIAKWSDIVSFEVYPVMTSKEATDKISSQL